MNPGGRRGEEKKKTKYIGRTSSFIISYIMESLKARWPNLFSSKTLAASGCCYYLTPVVLLAAYFDMWGGTAPIESNISISGRKYHLPE